jgi:hypothetical protein
MLLHLVSLVLGFFNMVFRGFLIKTFWAWFIISIFPSLPPLSVISAIGVSMFISLFHTVKTVTKEQLDDLFRAKTDEERDDALRVSTWNACFLAAGMLMCWGVGWIVHFIIR